MTEKQPAQDTPIKQRISKLLQDLKISQPSSSPSATQHQQVQHLKSTIHHKYALLHEKVGTAIAMLSQIQKDQGEAIISSKQNLRLAAEFENNIEQMHRDAILHYAREERQLQSIGKEYGKKILDAKLLAVQQDQKSAHDVQFCNTELLPFQLAKLGKSRRDTQLEVEELKLRNKVKVLKRDVQENCGKDNSCLRKIKNSVLGAFEQTLADIQKQENLINESFDLHFQTLQKIVASISDRLQA